MNTFLANSNLGDSRNPLNDTVRHSVLGSLQDGTCHFRGFVLAETLVQNDEPVPSMGIRIGENASRHAHGSPKLPQG